MAKKLTLKEWNEKFLSEFSTQIDDFRHDTNKLISFERESILSRWKSMNLKTTVTELNSP